MSIPLKKKREKMVTEYYCVECEEWLRENQTWVCESCGKRFCNYDERGFVADTDDDVCYLCDGCCNEESATKKRRKRKKNG